MGKECRNNICVFAHEPFFGYNILEHDFVRNTGMIDPNQNAYDIAVEVAVRMLNYEIQMLRKATGRRKHRALRRISQMFQAALDYQDTQDERVENVMPLTS